MLNDYQLQRGMRRTLLSGKPHPPSLPEFMKLCRTVGHADDIPDETPRPAFAQLPGSEWDTWDIAANQRLLSYVLTAATKRRYFGGPETRVLVAFKNRWADLMRSTGEFNEVSLTDQSQSWNECMRMAEEEIAHA